MRKENDLISTRKSAIKRYIDIHSSSGELDRGKWIFSQNAIERVQSSPSSFSLIVTDDEGKYKVDVRMVPGITTECSCSYDWGGICKHTVAALLYLMEDKPSKEKGTERKSTNHLPAKNSFAWFYFPNYQTLTFDRVRQMSTYDNFNLSARNVALLEEADKKGIHFLVFEHYAKARKVDVKIRKHDLGIRCNCRTKVKGLCQHQIAVLFYIMDDLGFQYIESHDPVYMEAFKKKVFEEYGVPENENFDDWFDLSYSNGIQAIPHKKGLGLIKRNEYQPGEDTESLSRFFHRQEQKYFNRIDSKKSKPLELGFVLLTGEELIHIKPIIGQSNSKGELYRNINEYHNVVGDAIVELTGDDERLLKYVDMINPVKVANSFDLPYREDRNFAPQLIEKNRDEVIAYYISKLRKIVPLLAEQKYVSKSEHLNISRRYLTPTRVSATPPHIFFRIREDDTFVSLEFFLKLGEEEVNLYSFDLSVLSTLCIAYKEIIYFFKSYRDLLTFQEFKDTGLKKMVKTEFDNFFADFIKPVAEYYPVEFDLPGKEIVSQELKAKEKALYISEWENFVVFKPVVDYGDDRLVNILKPGRDYLSKEGERIEVGKRDKEYESSFETFLRSLHPAFEGQEEEEFFYLSVDEMMEDYWFFDAFERLKEEGVEVYGIRDLKNFNYAVSRGSVSVGISSGEDWFDVNIEVKFGDQSVALKDIRKSILRKEKYVKLGDGTYGILPEEWAEKFQAYFRQGEVKGGKLKISKLNFAIIDRLFNERDYVGIAAELAEKRRKLKEFTEIKKVRTPRNFHGKLRNYQKAGVSWLNFLDEYRWGGILADDMGLGKTIQILAFLLRQVKKYKQANLVIIPTTLLFNWKDEIERFTPSLKTHYYHGTNREKDAKIFRKYNVIITTYGTLVKDIEIFRSYRFNYVILDESQAIKNPNSQRFKAASLLRARNRIAMSGTPIENNTFDLFAQMEVVNPGFLGSQNSFKNNYSNPIDKDQDPVVAAELQNKISPFVLRRTKEQVATELPPKTEDYVFCEMEPQQRAVYETFKNKYRNMLLRHIEKDGLQKSKIFVLQGLTKLRQICDSPEILSDKEDYGSQSVKVKELLRHIKEKTGNHKILVFSQFVKMLKVIRRELEKEGVKYEYLDGKSSKKKREESVNNFQTDTSIRVFLVSLKAGGTGLNLTAADYVYIVDPWWNPAVENQAIDRSYRIGQDKKVIAYRMICKDTIEEKIMRYQSKKKKIAAGIITTDDSFVKQLKREDIEHLFS